MRIKIITQVPTIPSPAVGQECEVVRIKKRSEREGGDVHFVMCEGEEVGVLSHEMTVIER